MTDDEAKAIQVILDQTAIAVRMEFFCHMLTTASQSHTFHVMMGRDGQPHVVVTALAPTSSP